MLIPEKTLDNIGSEVKNIRYDFLYRFLNFLNKTNEYNSYYNIDLDLYKKIISSKLDL